MKISTFELSISAVLVLIIASALLPSAHLWANPVAVLESPGLKCGVGGAGWVAEFPLAGVEGIQLQKVGTKRGLFAVDLQPAFLADAADGRVLDVCTSGINLRWAQHDGEHRVVRIVAETAPGWSCTSKLEGPALFVRCSSQNAPAIGIGSPGASPPVFARIRGVDLAVPLAGLSVEEALRKSLLYTPKDMMRDGLPYFGALRDDWKAKPRMHLGIDIYVDRMDVLASAPGTVVGRGGGSRAGSWLKIRHRSGVESVYVHLAKIFVEKGDIVTRGMIVGRIRGAMGNAIEPQLHYEVKVDGHCVDPIPFVTKVNDRPEIWELLIQADELKEKNFKAREEKVRRYRSQH